VGKTGPYSVLHSEAIPLALLVNIRLGRNLELHDKDKHSSLLLLKILLHTPMCNLQNFYNYLLMPRCSNLACLSHSETPVLV